MTSSVTAATADPSGAALLAALTAAFAEEGLFVVRPLGQAALDAAGIALRLEELMPGAEAGLIIGDGGSDFFSRFAGRQPAGPDPLDRHTRGVVTDVLARLAAGPLAGIAHRARFPFDEMPLPVQRLGEAAGLPPAGPLGIQIHPRFGPWWAYRALVLLAAPLPSLPPLPRACPGCPAPCVAVCPGQAVRGADAGGFAVNICASHRLGHPPCQRDCIARRACVVAPAAAYSPQQLAFHMDASLVMVRAYTARLSSSPRG